MRNPAHRFSAANRLQLKSSRCRLSRERYRPGMIVASRSMYNLYSLTKGQSGDHRAQRYHMVVSKVKNRTSKIFSA
jgi:hypothetical protein